MVNLDFTHTDYFTASLTRQNDYLHLKNNPMSTIFAVYCAGVAIECMFRAYIVRYTKEFDSRHDIDKLFVKSQLSNKLDSTQKEVISIAVKKANNLWKNEFRYVSEVRMKRIIAHKIVKKGYTDINKYIVKYNKDLFDAAEIIIKIGSDKWN